MRSVDGRKQTSCYLGRQLSETYRICKKRRYTILLQLSIVENEQMRVNNKTRRIVIFFVFVFRFLVETTFCVEMFDPISEVLSREEEVQCWARKILVCC
jgi:hypothetical protein